ncbi:FUSC family protein [Cryobacterium sp. CG_9.6]|uniref:FUSC family protein n=1 Tax=Cryobacterium sp. CG_9.6 TaxID=2760710 RepID=UPI002475CE61|nr:FUSC family protein [Cryobacterium sp. CG_9.6]MDH6237949.1 putative membrane protein [Cryobacterium sp. CG_9.6]
MHPVAPPDGDSAQRSAPETLAQWARSLRAFHFEVASRAALAVALPLIILLLTDHLDWAAYAAFGAMTSLFGRNEPYRVRMRTVTVAALLMLAFIMCGLVLAVVQASLVGLTVGLVIVLAVSMVMASTAGLFPATPVFFVFGYAVVAQLPTPEAELWPRFFVAVAAAGFAWALTMSGWLLRRLAGERSDALFKNLLRGALVRPTAYRDRQVWFSVLQNVLGALVAGGLAMVAGIGHPYWAVVSVVAVLPPPGAAHSVSRAFHRIIGTAVGVVIAAVVLLPGPPVVVLILVIAICQFGAEMLIGRHYGAALLFVTPLALTVVHLTSPVAVNTLLVDRVIETTLGAGIALVIVLLVQAGARRRELRALQF